jgi:hypothetical protein
MTDLRRLDGHTMETRGERPDPASRTERQPTVKLTGVVAAGLAAAVAAFFTSRFGITGTVLGTALTAMIITVGSALLGFYLERAAAKARSVPEAIRVRPPRRSVLLGGFLAAAASFVVGIGVVTGVELSVGKSLSCWVWNDCLTKDDGGGAASEGTTRTRPSILGGGQKTIDPTPQPGDVEHPGPIATPRGQEVPSSPHAPQGLPGGSVVRLDPAEPTQFPAAPARDARPHQAPGDRLPAQGRSEGTPPDEQATEEEPSPAPDGSDQLVPPDDPPEDRPPLEQPVRRSPSIMQ